MTVYRPRTYMYTHMSASKFHRHHVNPCRPKGILLHCALSALTARYINISEYRYTCYFLPFMSNYADPKLSFKTHFRFLGVVNLEFMDHKINFIVVVLLH